MTPLPPQSGWPRWWWPPGVVSASVPPRRCFSRWPGGRCWPGRCGRWSAETIGPVVVVAGSHTLDAVGHLVRDEGFTKVQAIVAGGERRQDSVGAGLAALPEGVEIVVIHDGARPLAEPELFDRCAAAAAESGAAIAATPVSDTLKRVAEGDLTGTVDRAGLWAAQTRRHSASHCCAGR